MRFYVSPCSIFPDKGIIQIKDKNEIHHIRNVMRLKKGAAPYSREDVIRDAAREFGINEAGFTRIWKAKLAGARLDNKEARELFFCDVRLQGW